jgi:hypothetical protein
MEFMPSESIDHFEKLHQRKETDADPEARLTADVREQIDRPLRRRLSFRFHDRRLSNQLNRKEIPSDFVRPIRRPICWQRNGRILHETFDSAQLPVERRLERGDLQWIIDDRTLARTAGTELVEEIFGRVEKIRRLTKTRSRPLAKRREENFLRSRSNDRSGVPLSRIDASALLVAGTIETR